MRGNLPRIMPATNDRNVRLRSDTHAQANEELERREKEVEELLGPARVFIADVMSAWGMGWSMLTAKQRREAWKRVKAPKLGRPFREPAATPAA